MRQDMKTDYKKYCNNNKLICEKLTSLIANSENIEHIMASDFDSKYSRIGFIKETYIFNSNFFICDFKYTIKNSIFENVEFCYCTFSMPLENVQFINCKFRSCTFYTGTQNNCTFNKSLIEDCIFRDCKTYGKNDFLSAKEIINPTFVDCILPKYITYDFIYEQGTEQVSEMHTTLYLFIESGKFICKNGMMNIDDCIKDGHISGEFTNKFNRNGLSIPIDALNELIAKRNVQISKMVLDRLNDK